MSSEHGEEDVNYSKTLNKIKELAASCSGIRLCPVVFKGVNLTPYSFSEIDEKVLNSHVVKTSESCNEDGILISCSLTFRQLLDIDSSSWSAGTPTDDLLDKMKKRRKEASKAVYYLDKTLDVEQLHHLSDILAQFYNEKGKYLKNTIGDTLAAHLFNPLTGSTVFMSPNENEREVNENMSSNMLSCICKCVGQCRNNQCMDDINKTFNIGLGIPETWHGPLDMLAGDIPVFLLPRTVPTSTTTPSSMDTRKHGSANFAKYWHQFLAQTVVFSIARNNCYEISKQNFCPCVLIDDEKYCIGMYHPVYDILLVSDKMCNLTTLDESQEKFKVVVENVVALWFILNCATFFKTDIVNENVRSFFPKTGFKEWCTKNELSPYYDSIRGLSEDMNYLSQYRCSSYPEKLEEPMPKKVKLMRSENFE